MRIEHTPPSRIRKQPFNPLTSWTREEVIGAVPFAALASLVGIYAALEFKSSEEVETHDALPEPLSGRWSETSKNGWRVRQTEELLLKARFDAMSDAPFVMEGGEFQMNGQETGILLSRYELQRTDRLDFQMTVRATVSLADGKKDDVLLLTFSESQRWMVTFEHPEAKVVRHFHILPLPEGQLQVVPMQLTRAS